MCPFVLSQEVCGSLPFPAGVMRLMPATNKKGAHLPRGSWRVLLIRRGDLLTVPGHQPLQRREGEPVDGTGTEPLQRSPMLWRAVSLVLSETIAGVYRVEFNHHPVAADLGHDRRGSDRQNAGVAPGQADLRQVLLGQRDVVDKQMVGWG